MDYEQLVQKVYQAVLRPGDVAVDIGAHIGHHTIPMADKVMPGGSIHAFEPLPMCRKVIEDRLITDRHLRKIVKVYDIALGETSASTEFVVASDALAYSGLRERTYDKETRIERIPIKVRRLDDVLGDLRALRYIKVDAEGGELHALRGAEGLIKRHAPVVGFEFGENSISEYGITCADMGAFWLDRGYLLFDVLARPIKTVEEFVASARRQDVWDYVAIPAKKTSLTQIVLEALHAAIQ